MGTREDLAEKLGIKQQWISHLLATSKLGERYSPRLEIPTSAIVDAAGLPGEERVKILETHEKGLVEAASLNCCSASPNAHTYTEKHSVFKCLGGVGAEWSLL